MTRAERFRNYLVRIVGPQPFITAAATAGISQAEDTPKEWRGGAEGYGKRIGNAYAQQFIRGTLEYGISDTLHEDSRYFKSVQTGLFRAHQVRGSEHAPRTSRQWQGISLLFAHG